MATVYKEKPNTVAKDAAFPVNVDLGGTGIGAGSMAVRMSKNGGAIASVPFTVAEIGENQYQVAVSAATNDTAGLAMLIASAATGLTICDVVVEDGAKTAGELNSLLNAGTTVVTPKDASITAAKIATDAITAAKIEADAITAAKIATDAIDADAIKADANTAIASAVWASGTRELTDLGASAVAGIWAELLSNITTSGSVGLMLKTNLDAVVSTIDTVVDAIKVQTDKLTFDGSNHIESVPQEDVTVAAASEASIVDAVWDETVTDHNTTGTFGRALRLIRAYIYGKRTITGSSPTLTEKVYDYDGVSLLSTHTVTLDANDDVSERSERS